MLFIKSENELESIGLNKMCDRPLQLIIADEQRYTTIELKNTIALRANMNDEHCLLDKMCWSWHPRLIVFVFVCAAQCAYQTHIEWV